MKGIPLAVMYHPFLKSLIAIIDKKLLTPNPNPKNTYG